MSKKQIIIRDLRVKEKFFIDDLYLNGYARILKPSTTAVYFSLCRHAGKNQTAFPSQELIAKEHGISANTVYRGIRKLKNANIIAIEQKKSEKGIFNRNVYTLLDKAMWKSKEEAKKLTVPHQWRTVNRSPKNAKTVPQMRRTKDTHIKDTQGALRKSSEYLTNIPSDDIQELARKFKIPPGVVKNAGEEASDWLKSKGKTRKDHKAFLRNWFRKPFRKMNQPAENNFERLIRQREEK